MMKFYLTKRGLGEKGIVRFFFLLIMLTVFVGQANATTSPRTWYPMTDGDWNDAIWTLDPAGLTTSIPSEGYTVPQEGDNVVILSGKTVTIPDGETPYESSDKLSITSYGTVTIQGNLDIRSFSGLVFDNLKGGGRLLMSADNYPSVTTNDYFSAEDEDEGTVVYYGDGFNVSNEHTFYNLEIALTSGIVVQKKDLMLNGSLLVKTGTLQINDDSSTTPLNITVRGDVQVNTSASIITGKGNADNYGNYHERYNQFILYGDFKNYGTVSFTNLSAPSYNSYSGFSGETGVVTLKFKGTSNNDFITQGTTDLYDLVIDKGTDRSYIVTVQSDNYSHFRLFGSNNVYSGGSDPYVNRALYIHRGTLKLTGSIYIPSLTEGNGDFVIGYYAKLWIAGSDVKVYTTAESQSDILGFETTASGVSSGTSESFSIYGEFEMTAGYVNTRNGADGFRVLDSAEPAFKISGGEFVTKKFYLANSYSSLLTFQQTGGVINVTESDFDLNHEDAVFYMTGGTINVDKGNFRVISDDGNYEVSGGTINLSGTSNTITSTPNLWNVNLTGSASYKLANELVVSNNLSIASGCTLNSSNGTVYDLSIGGDFENDGTYTPNTNITTFIEDKNSAVSGNIAFNELVLDKDADSDIVSLGTGTISVAKDLTITKGTLNVGTLDRNVTGNVEIVSGGITGEYNESTLKNGSIVLNNSSTAQTLKGKRSAEQEFGSITLNNSKGLTLLSDVNVTDFTFTSGMVNLDTYNLTVSGDLSGAGISHYFYTSGEGSDGGLTLGFTIDNSFSSIVFPVGSSSNVYKPATVSASVSSGSYSGYYTVIPVNSAHPATAAGKESDVLPYYWKTKVTGFNTLPNDKVQLDFAYNSTISNNFHVIWLKDTDWKLGNAKLNGRNYLTFNNTTNYGSFENLYSGDFTAAKDANTLKNIQTFYSSKSTDGTINKEWRNVTWYDENDNQINDDPGVGDIVVIRDGDVIKFESAYNDKIDVGMLKFEHDTTTASNVYTKLSRLMIHQGRSVNFDQVEGTGMVQIYLGSNSPTVTGDFGDFVNEKYSCVNYTAEANVNVPTYFDSYPNLATEGNYTLTFSNDITINGNLTVRGSSTALINSNVTVEGNLNIGDYQYGVVQFATGQSHSNDYSLTVEGDIDMTLNTENDPGDYTARGLKATQTAYNDADILKLIVYGDIKQYKGSISLSNVDLEFVGDKYQTVSKEGSQTTSLYRIIVDKSEDKEVYFDDDFTFGGSVYSYLSYTKRLKLVSGICHLDDSGINFDLSTSSPDFEIPQESQLIVDGGAQVNVSGSSTGIWLDGLLKVNNGGKIYCNGGSDNYIEYSTSGHAQIWLGDDSKLYVGSQIRRSTSLEFGILGFNQASSSSEVIIGEDGAPELDRGVFEITGEGSSFKQAAGASITIVRGQYKQYSSSDPSVAALYFDPDTVSIGDGAGFVLGTSATVDNSTIQIYATKPLGNITVTGSRTAEVSILPLTLQGDLTINSSGTFDANGLDLTIQGDFTDNGTFTSNKNNTYFNGEAAQTISGTASSIEFYNLEQDNSNTLTVSNSGVIVDNDLTINEDCTFATGANTVTVKGDVTNDGTTSASGVSEGILMEGSEMQQLGGSGTFARLTINNSNDVTLPTQGDPSYFTDFLRLEDGILNVGQNLLIFEEKAIVEDGDGNSGVNYFSTSNMIQTNLSLKDNGVEKIFPAVSSTDAAYSFVYPIGSVDKYTPVTFTVSANGNNTGSITVKTTDEAHSTVEEANLSDVLQYYWSLDADGIEDMTAAIAMQGILDDVALSGDNEASDYITARILSANDYWNKYDKDDFDETNTILNFSLDGSDSNISGDYTAGITDALPTQVATYITVDDGGNWKESATWESYDPDTESTTGTAGPDGGPRGCIAYVNKNVVMSENSKSAFRTVILDDGVIKVGTTYGHSLGTVTGTGTLQLSSSSIPAGSYDKFFSEDGGTLEYVENSSTSYDILGNIPQVNNLKVTGISTASNELRIADFESGEIQILGDLTINDGAVLDNTNNVDIQIKGDVIFNSGTFKAENGAVIFNGSNNQTVTGLTNFTADDGGSLYDLEINNTAGVTIDNGYKVEVSHDVIFTDGVIHTDEGGDLTITNTAETAGDGGSSSSYVQGPLKKKMGNGGSFTFPVGDDSRYGEVNVVVASNGAGIWDAQYYNANPIYNTNRAMDPETVADGVNYVSHNEYWRIYSESVSTTADVTLRWDDNSSVIADETFEVVQWTDVNGDDPSITDDVWNKISTSGNSYESSSSTATRSFSFNHFSSEGNYITFGASQIPEYTWLGVTNDWFTTTNWQGGKVPSAGVDVTINKNGSYDPSIANNSQVALVHDLTIATDASVTLESGGLLTVGGDLKTNNNLIINHTLDDPASLLVFGTITDDATVSLIDNFTYKKYRLIGVTADGVTKSEIDASYSNGYYMYQYASNAWSLLSDTYAEFDSYPMRGYYLGSKGDGENLSYSGELHNSASYTHTSPNRKWQLVCNPYPCYIDITSSGFALDGNCEQAVYIRRSSDNEVQTYWLDSTTPVSVNGASKLLAPGQGFWVWAEASGAKITIAKAARTNSGGTVGFKSASASSDVLRLSMTNGTLEDETVVVFRSDGADSYSNSDIDKMTNSGTNINFYSLKDKEELVINLMPELYDGEVIPLGYSLSSSDDATYTIKLSSVSFDGYSVYLDDLEEGVSVSLDETEEYSFTSSESSDGRFQIRIASSESMDEEETTTGIDDATSDNISVYSFGQTAYVTVGEEWLESNSRVINLYNVAGQLVQSEELDNLETQFTLPGEGVYLIKVVSGGMIYTKKVVRQLGN